MLPLLIILSHSLNFIIKIMLSSHICKSSLNSIPPPPTVALKLISL
nr:MAG TPA_asm: hypothetical protein [Caudoviricetes sp.]